MSRLTIAHLYPREMNIYGDLGNIITLRKRLEWRGYEVTVKPVEAGQPFDWDVIDMVFGGGGQDSGQLVMGPDLQRHAKPLHAMATAGVPMLVICGSYQLFGRRFHIMDGEDVPGIGIFKAETVSGPKRMIGNVVIETSFGQLVGFENHSGQTLLDVGQEPLGRVRKGFGNEPKHRREGAITHNVIGTYLHGPILPKNPRLADHLISAALKHRFGIQDLEPLDDALEFRAAQIAAGRPQ